MQRRISLVNKSVDPETTRILSAAHRAGAAADISQL